MASSLSSGCILAKIQVAEFLSIGGTEWYLWDMYRIKICIVPNTCSNSCLISAIKFLNLAAALEDTVPVEYDISSYTKQTLGLPCFFNSSFTFAIQPCRSGNISAALA